MPSGPFVCINERTTTTLLARFVFAQDLASHSAGIIEEEHGVQPCIRDVVETGFSRGMNLKRGLFSSDARLKRRALSQGMPDINR
jgi:hypothetical protein